MIPGIHPNASVVGHTNPDFKSLKPYICFDTHKFVFSFSIESKNAMASIHQSTPFAQVFEDTELNQQNYFVQNFEKSSGVQK